MAIEYDLNALQAWLEQPDNKEIGAAIRKELEYLTTQQRNTRSHMREYLMLLTIKNIIVLMNEYPAMMDGRTNNNEPF